MNLKIFNGLPTYVRITILSQIRRLLSTSVFNKEDCEDIAQDLLLFYLKRFYTIPDADEALVVHSLKQYAINLLKKQCNRKDYLNSSFEEAVLKGAAVQYYGFNTQYNPNPSGHKYYGVTYFDNDSVADRYYYCVDAVTGDLIFNSIMGD